MKRTLLILLLLVGVLVLFGNYLAARALDSQISPLLTRVLGLPVEIAPIRANLLQLKATSDELLMGDRADPAVHGAGLEVRLSLAALLEGEIRFDYAGAADLTVAPGRWPAGDGGPIEDLLFLEQWLPGDLELEAGRLVFGAYTHPVTDLAWVRRGDGGADLSWREARGPGVMTVSATLANLADLLSLKPIALDVEVAMEGNPDSRIEASTHIAPGEGRAWELWAELSADAFDAEIVAGHPEPWQLPDSSELKSDTVFVDRLSALVAAYNPTDDPTPLSSRLDSALPRLALPEHLGRVHIKALRLGDELGEETTFNIVTGQTGIGITDLRSAGPEGRISGNVHIDSGDSGWSVEVDAAMRARENAGGIAAQFIDSRWRWRTGDTNLYGNGTTWAELLYSMAGSVSLGGYHRGANETPIDFVAHLDNRPGAFALDEISLTAGDGSITGSASLSGTGEDYKLGLALVGTSLHLDFLFESAGEEAPDAPGLALPEYLRLFPGLELDLRLDADTLSVPGLTVRDPRATLQRHALGGTLALSARGLHQGSIRLTLDAAVHAAGPEEFHLNADLERVDLAALFRQQGTIYSRSTGSMAFASTGEGMRQIFERMAGRADVAVEFRADDNWNRPTGERERLELAGDASLVVQGERIVGLSISGLDIQSLEQDLTGTLSLVDGRTPWLQADLASEMLNITNILEILPESTEAADERDALQLVRNLGDVQLELDATSLVIADTPLRDLRLEVVSGDDVLDIRTLDFGADGSGVKSRGKVSWQGETATLESQADLADVNIDQFLIHDPDWQYVPVSGSLQLRSEGTSVAELAGRLQGFADLAATAQPRDAVHKRRRLALEATRLPDGMQAQIKTLQWGESELTGQVRYREQNADRATAHWDIDIERGVLNLLPWEDAYEKDDTTQTDSSGTSLRQAARTSAGFVGDLLMTPVRMLADSGQQDSGPAKNKIFSTEPLPLETLTEVSMDLDGQVDSLVSKVLKVDDLSVTAHLADGVLDLKLHSEHMNQGSGDFALVLDAGATPATAKVNSTFRDIRGLSGGETYPRSGYLDIEASGNSTAALAASVSGLFYLELGKGPFDYVNSSLLTADIATTVFRRLIPGIDKRLPSLDCGVTVFLAEDGIVATPLGFAARTNSANLIGRLEVDLRRERLQLSFDSRSREGVGISVGSVFSNTIQVRGSLSDPGIVPNTTGIIWRGAAAFMTGGLSIVGESVVKRALASDNPCKSLRKLIDDEMCKKNPQAAESEMVCP